VAFLRREPLHVKLAREAGLDLEGRPPHDTTPRWGEAGIHGVARPREWDAVGMCEVHGLEGDQVEFVALPDGLLIVDGRIDDEALNLLADAVDLEPPYRAFALRRHETRWAVGARRIEVAELPDAPSGAERIELTTHDGERSLLVDGARVFGGPASLERLADTRYPSYVAEAERLDGDLWELRVSPL
jgi:hypothetical protein